ncbi:hypothetical protein GOBAR_DD26849 [Gossypium barbadense]|nr:hypothetical protein GOBAR_DD26849 [Gossypium barbadense]
MDEMIRLWVAEIRELAYDAEDVVEEFALKIGSKNKGGPASCIKRSACCLKEGWALHKTRSKIEKIKERINDLVRKLQAYGVKDRGEESSSSTERRESRRPYPHIMDDNIVGLADDTEGLVKVLTEESGCKVVTIWGMGGLGKTSLAKKIYHHRQVIDYFDHLAFVYVSQPCQKRNVWEDILSGFKTLDKVDRKIRDEALAEKLYNILGVKKCLVILDDIWTTEAWDSLKPAFPVATGRHSNSKILLTSRNRGIVSDADIRELKCLNDQQSWELFQKIVFPQTGKYRYRLPLAIVVLGGILATKNNSLNEWRKISDNVKSYLKRGKNQGPEDVLALSYDDLPPYLRPLEKSLPLEVLNYVEEHEDYDCNPLYWILFISGISTMALKIRGIWRYMFDNFKLLRALNYERTGGDPSVGFKLPSNIGNLVHLRFLSLRNLNFHWSKLPSSLGNLRCLQTLDLRVENVKIHVPNVIWRMEQLRHLYLPLRCKSRTKLKLGTLSKLLTLVNFNTKNCYLKDLINMTNLRELGINLPFNIENFNKKELGENPPIIGSKYLHSLFIVSIGESGSEIDPRHLAHLLSNCTSICNLSIAARISELPEYHYFSSHLAYIRLSWFKFRKDPMPTLEKLPNLRILEFESSFKGKEMFCSVQGFPKLESLILGGLENLEEWKMDEGAMPFLQRLEITYCRRLKMLPEGLRFITTLKELKIELMPKAFKDRLEEGGEDFYKVKHVPSIIFQNWG